MTTAYSVHEPTSYEYEGRGIEVDKDMGRIQSDYTVRKAIRIEVKKEGQISEAEQLSGSPRALGVLKSSRLRTGRRALRGCSPLVATVR
ncbi:hypothetical protein CLCR_05267 [Cladophialophora carrionii]|uniref:Uncharacterized protein n=1 Tax=Cladophialophora carrionii TaxID=86049 RepID=A0A1C1CJL0_9EURO|nr:hypothetical protein CLCR_05267 [Cladophialophora carrionii]